MKIWKVGFIGVGNMGQEHLKKVMDMENAQVVALCDTNAAELHKVADKLGLPEGKRYNDFQKTIADPDVEAIISCVLNKYHFDILKCAIESNKPVFSEKPFTRTIEEAETLAQLYDKSPVPCVVGYSYRYFPCFRRVKELLDEGISGRIRHISAHYLQEENVPMLNHEYTWRFSQDMAGTGVLGDLGAHIIDAARFFVGEFVEVSGLMRTFVDVREDKKSGRSVNVDVDDFAGFQGTFSEGIVGTFFTHKNAVGTGNQFTVTLFGDLGTASICTEDPCIVHLTLRDSQTFELTESKIHVQDNATDRITQDFIYSLDHQESRLLPTFMDGVENQKVMQLIMESAAEGKVKVNRRMK